MNIAGQLKINQMLSSSERRDVLKYARVFAKQNPNDDGYTDQLVKALARLFPRAELAKAEQELSGRRLSRALNRQLQLVRRAKRITYLPLNRRWR